MTSHYEDTRIFIQKIDSRMDALRRGPDDAESKALTRLLFEAIGMVNTLEPRDEVQQWLYEAMNSLAEERELDRTLDFVRAALEPLPKEIK
jgi:hypothetical protein